ANTADIFTKALPPGGHERFCTMLACFALRDWSYDLLFSPTLPMGEQLEVIDPDLKVNSTTLSIKGKDTGGSHNCSGLAGSDLTSPSK
ncbi:unnamed protein product, partial [Closterium sp. NIES-53]